MTPDYSDGEHCNILYMSCPVLSGQGLQGKARLIRDNCSAAGLHGLLYIDPIINSGQIPI